MSLQKAFPSIRNKRSSFWPTPATQTARACRRSRSISQAATVTTSCSACRLFCRSLRDNLGVQITLDNSRTQDEINQLIADTGGLQFAIMWWQTVTDTPYLLSDVFRPDSPYMDGVFNWSPDLEPIGGDPGAAASQFADLVAQADVALDTPTRNDLYKQAEQLVLDNAVYVPIANWVPMFVQKPWLQGTRQGPWTGRLPILFDKDVVVLAQ